MISRIEALNYRCLKYVNQALLPFHVLVGPNASGKSTFLDVLAFMSDLVFLGPSEAIENRAPDLRDLVWMRQGTRFELAVEVSIPQDRRQKLINGSFTGARYELAIGHAGEEDAPTILVETFWLTTEQERSAIPPSQRTLFPQPPRAPARIVYPSGRKAPKGWKRVVNKVAESRNDYFSSETSGWNNLFRLGPPKSALANLPEDETKFPVATWFKELLMVGVQTLMLNSARMRQPSPPRGPSLSQTGRFACSP